MKTKPRDQGQDILGNMESDAVDTMDSSGVLPIQYDSFYVDVEGNDKSKPARSTAPPSSKRRLTSRSKSNEDVVQVILRMEQERQKFDIRMEEMRRKDRAEYAARDSAAS